MTTIQLPRLAGSRYAAGVFLDTTPAVTPGEHIYVDCSPLRTGTASFASKVLEELLVRGHAGHVTFVAAPADFAALVRTAAERRDLSDRIDFVDERLPRN